MNVALDILKGVATVVGGTILVFGGVFAVAVPLMLLNEKLRGRGRRRRRSAGPSEFGRLRSRMVRLAQPTLLLAPARAPGFSKLGGSPELPAGMEWPTDHGEPRVFIGQIDLEDLNVEAGVDWLPSEGRLYAFVDETRYGFPDLVRVVFSTQAAGPVQASSAKSFQERRIAFQGYRSLPSLDWLGVDLTEIDVSAEELDRLSSMPDEPFGDEIQHRIGGYPSEIQGDQMGMSCELIRRGLPSIYEGTEITPAIERAAKQWRLLFQIDSDPALAMNWGDGGRLYVFVREKDARAGEFSRAITISQSY